MVEEMHLLKAVAWKKVSKLLKKPSIRDVARLASCSTATVSLAMRDSDKVLPATRQRVLEAAAQLNYRPNLTASRLSSKRSYVVGIILLPLQHDEGLQMLYGITEELQAKGFRSLIEFSGMSYEKEQLAVRRFIDEGVDGVLIHSAIVTQEPTHLLELQRLKIPFVLMDLRVQGIDGSYVGMQNDNGACRAVQHLIDSGHRRIACVGNLFRRDTESKRLDGYRRALSQNGLVADPDLLIEGVCISLADYVLTGKNKEARQKSVEVQVREGLQDTAGPFRQALERVLGLADPPTAFFAMDSGALLSLLVGLKQLGVAVPDGASIAAFEGIPYLSPLGIEVATLLTPAYQIGAQASRLLIEHIETGGQRPAVSIEIDPEFLPGDSVKPPRRVDAAGAGDLPGS